MKKFLLLILTIIVIAGCSKQDVADNDPIDVWNGYQNYKIDMTVPLMAGQHIDVGTVNYDMTGGNFIVTYTLTGGWTMSLSHVYAGDYSAMPVNKPGAPKIGKFPYSVDHNPSVTSYVYTIPCADLPTGDIGFVCAAHCDVQGPNGQGETGWASGNSTFSDKGWGTYTSDFYQVAMDITIIYGIVQNDNDGTLTLLHIDGTTHIGEVIMAETIATSGTVDAAAYDPVTETLFFVIGNTLYANNMNSEDPSVAVGTISGLANGGVFLDGNYYYVDVDPNSPNYMEIIEVVLTYDDNNGSWSMTENVDYNSAMPYTGVSISDIANDGTNFYLIGTNDNGTPTDYTDDEIYLIVYDPAGGGSWSGTIPAELIGNGGSPQIAFGADGNLYAIDVNDNGDTVLKMLDPTNGDHIPTDNDDIGVGDGEGLIDIAPGPIR